MIDLRDDPYMTRRISAMWVYQQITRNGLW